MKKNYILILTLLITILSFGQTRDAQGASLYINEIDPDQAGSDTAEFVEVIGNANTSLDGYVIVMFNGSDDLSSAAYDLDGFSTDANGFFILANATHPNYNATTDMELPSNGLQNGADAVALYFGDATDFPNDTPITTTNLLNVVVYGTNDSDDTGLLTGFGETVQYNDTAAESIQRIATDGTFETKPATFRADNDSAVCDLVLGSISAICDAFTAGTDTYTTTINFTGGGTSTYTITSTAGTVDLTAGNPDTDATGVITITGIAEGTNVDINVNDGTLCDLNTMITSPVCIPSLPLPLYEGFDYTAGENLGDQTDWENISGTTNEIDIVANSLSYTGLQTSTGNSVTLEGGAIDSEITFTPVSTGTVFTSFLFQITDQSAIIDLIDGGYFAVLGYFDARFWVHPDTDPVGTTFDVAVTNTSSGATFSTTKYNVGDTLFVVMSYEISTGVVNGWINPSASDFGGSAPAVTMTDTDSSPSAFVDRFILRQDSTNETPAITFDELRIGTTWAEVTPANTVSVGNNEIAGFSIYPNPVVDDKIVINTLSTSTKTIELYNILGSQVYNSSFNGSNTEINLSKLNAGVYIVKVQEGTHLVATKLVIK